MCAATLAQWLRAWLHLRQALLNPQLSAPHLSRRASDFAARCLGVNVLAALSSVKEPQPQSKRACEIHAEINEHFGANKWFKSHAVDRPSNGAQHETAAHHAQQPRGKERAVNGKNWVACAEKGNDQQQRDRARGVFPRSCLRNFLARMC